MSLTRRQNLNYFFLAFSIATIFLILSLNPATAEKLVLEEYGGSHIAGNACTNTTDKRDRDFPDNRRFMGILPGVCNNC
ncbi:MAG: hypothetical protein R2741_11860 [Methanolobus sp.]